MITRKILKFSILHLILIFASLACLLPLLYVISISLSDERQIIELGYSLLPRGITLKAYKLILSEPGQILTSYGISILVTSIGTVLGLSFSSMVAYVITRRDFRFYGHITFLIFFPMLFSAGLVPFYIYVVKYLHLKNTIAILILPYLITPWLVLLLKGYLSQIPKSIIESGWIDGAGEIRIFLSIITPMSKSGLATVGLFFILMYWNDWWLALLFTAGDRLIPLQLLLQRILSNLEFMRSNMFNTASISLDTTNLPTETARMAIALLVAGPVLFSFPFIQKYLVKGITVGSLKS